MKWYHVTSRDHGTLHTFSPYVPHRLQKGEDRKTPRICVTDTWQHSLRSIIIIHLNRWFYVYSTEDLPIEPQSTREILLKEKNITRACNNFKLPPDGIINKEHWFLNQTQMKLEGHVMIPKDDYAAALMGLGMFNYPDIEKLKLIPGSISIEKMLNY